MHCCILVVSIILLASCAQIVSPGGGKKDVFPPKTLKYSPDSAKLEFNSKQIEIQFDEYIQLRDLNNQLIISPPLLKQPEISVKSKSLSVIFDKNEALKPNTTYCISFGNAIQDINEGNPLINFKYIFSTGTFIDSLKVKGKVQTAFDHKAEKDILVMLYAKNSDSVVYQMLPDYFSKTDASGNFEINNVREGAYKIVAIKDVNANYKYDGDSEAIAFYDSLVNPSSDKIIELELFQEPAKKVFLKKYNHPSYGKFEFVFNQGSDSIRILNLSNDLKGAQEYFEFSKNKDSLTYWITNYQKDSIKLQVSNGNNVIDTVEFKFINKDDALKSKKNPLKLSLVSSPNGSQSFDLNKNVVIGFSNPIKKITKPIETFLKIDSTKIISSKMEFISFELEKKQIHVLINDENNKSMVWKEGATCQLYIPPATFTDIFDLGNDTIKIDFKTREAKYYGSLKLNVKIPTVNKSYIFQLLDEKENVLQIDFIKKSQELSYEYLHPKKYKLKIIVDENSNEKWDTGNYLKHQQAEKIFYNSELINVRSNWDLELEWEIK